MEMESSIEVERLRSVKLFPVAPYYCFDFSTRLDAKTPVGFKRCTLRFDHFDYNGNTSAYAVVYGYYDGQRIVIHGNALPAQEPPVDWDNMPFEANCTVATEAIQDLKTLRTNAHFRDLYARVMIATGTMIVDQPGTEIVSPVIYNVVPADRLVDLDILVPSHTVSAPYRVFSDFRLINAVEPHNDAGGAGSTGTAQPTKLYPRTAYGSWQHTQEPFGKDFVPGRGYLYWTNYVAIKTISPDGSHEVLSQAQGSSWVFSVGEPDKSILIKAGVVTKISPEPIAWNDGEPYHEGTAAHYVREYNL
jgi:hypothetical protein